MFTVANSIHPNASTISPIHRQTTITAAIISTTSTAASLSSSNSTTEVKNNAFEDLYSPMTGIKTGATLSGMLFLMIVVIVLKSRARHCRCSFISRLRKNHNSNHPSKSTPSFDLDYWLKQVELREAKEAERLREVASPHLELPKEEPRDTQQATASWIVDAWQHWYLVHHEPRHSIHPTINSTALTCPSRRRPYLFFHRLFRRLFTSSKHRSPLILTDIYANVLDQDSIRASTMYDLQPRRVASWPCMQATSHSVHGTISALRIKQARQDLLQRTSKSTHHI